MQFPRHCVSPRNHIVGIATFADNVESSPNRIACEPAPSASCLRSSPHTWVRWYARGRRPGAYLGVGARVTGLTRIVSGSRASDTPSQAPLRPSRRLPCPQQPIVGVCYRGGLRRGRRRPEARPHRQQTVGIALHGDPYVTCSPMTSPPNGGNCTIRGATRRRHADRTLLMVQNPHHYPWCHAPSLVSWSHTGARLHCGRRRPEA